MKLLKAEVTFDGGYKNYQYLTDLETLEQDDEVVVETRNGYQIATFEGYVESAPKARSLIIQKVDVEKALRIHTKLEEIKVLKEKIEARIKERTFIEHAKEFAKDDDQLQALIDSYEGMV